MFIANNLAYFLSRSFLSNFQLSSLHNCQNWMKRVVASLPSLQSWRKSFKKLAFAVFVVNNRVINAFRKKVRSLCAELKRVKKKSVGFGVRRIINKWRDQTLIWGEDILLRTWEIRYWKGKLGFTREETNTKFHPLEKIVVFDQIHMPATRRSVHCRQRNFASRPCAQDIVLVYGRLFSLLSFFGKALMKRLIPRIVLVLWSSS